MFVSARRTKVCSTARGMDNRVLHSLNLYPSVQGWLVLKRTRLSLESQFYFGVWDEFSELPLLRTERKRECESLVVVSCDNYRLFSISKEGLQCSMVRWRGRALVSLISHISHHINPAETQACTLKKLLTFAWWGKQPVHCSQLKSKNSFG